LESTFSRGSKCDLIFYLLVRAISKALLVKKLDLVRLKSKLKAHKVPVEKQISIDGYLDLFELVYKRNSKDKLPFAFLAKKDASERKASFSMSARRFTHGSTGNN
jgi:hypothetical protein